MPVRKYLHKRGTIYFRKMYMLSLAKDCHSSSVGQLHERYGELCIRDLLQGMLKINRECFHCFYCMHYNIQTFKYSQRRERKRSINKSILHTAVDRLARRARAQATTMVKCHKFGATANGKKKQVWPTTTNFTQSSKSISFSPLFFFICSVRNYYEFLNRLPRS